MSKISRTGVFCILSLLILLVYVAFCDADVYVRIWKDADGVIHCQEVEMTGAGVSTKPLDGKYKGVIVDSSVSGGTPAPPTPPDPDEPDDPDSPGDIDEVEERAYNLAASLGSKQDAFSLSGFYRVFALLLERSKDPDIEEKVRDSFFGARRIATLGELEQNWDSAFSSLDKEMKQVPEGELKDWFTSVSKGFARYADTSAVKVLKGEAVETEAITDPKAIFRWIKLALTVLRLFGIDVGILEDLDGLLDELDDLL